MKLLPRIQNENQEIKAVIKSIEFNSHWTNARLSMSLIFHVESSFKKSLRAKFKDNSVRNLMSYDHKSLCKPLNPLLTPNPIYSALFLNFF